jgi:hypothetical protein
MQLCVGAATLQEGPAETIEARTPADMGQRG